MSVWSRHGLPLSLAGKSFVDVGCWEGDVCAEAVARNAEIVVGIDYCTSPDLATTLQNVKFDFLQMDILSEKLLQLPEFDVVHSAGVLYHVENPLSFLFRLRKLCKAGGSLHIETTLARGPTSQPVMLYHPDSSFDENPSNWWSPNKQCLLEMLKEIGLSDIQVTFSTFADDAPGSADFEVGRIAVWGRFADPLPGISSKILPRRPSYMPNSPGQGSRRGL